MRRELLLLEEIIDAAEQAHRLVDGVTVAELAADRQCCGTLTVLGEASTQLPPELKERFPEVPWDQPSRLRNRIVHGHRSIDLEILHTTAQDQLPDFAAQVREILAAVAPEADDSEA